MSVGRPPEDTRGHAANVARQSSVSVSDTKGMLKRLTALEYVRPPCGGIMTFFFCLPFVGDQDERHEG